MAHPDLVRDFLARLLVGPAVAASIGLLLKLGRFAIERTTPKRPGEFRLSSYFGATGLLCWAFAGIVSAIGLLGSMCPARSDFGAWLGIQIAFAAVGAYLIFCAAIWRMWLNEAGIQIRNEFGIIKPLTPWNNIARVRTKWTSVVVFELRGGGAVKVPFYTDGILEAVKAARAHGAELTEQISAGLQLSEDAAKTRGGR